jgi:hypothetical protein
MYVKMVLLLISIKFAENYKSDNEFLLSDIIRNVFLTEKCIYYISNNEKIDVTISGALLNANIEIINICHQSMLYEVERSQPHHCSGYLITTEKIDEIGHFLTEDLSNHGNILPHERILIFYSYKDILVDNLFITISRMYAVDIITVKLDISMMNLSLPLSIMSTVSVKSVYKDELLLSYANGTLDTKNLEQPTWVPEIDTFVVATFNCTPFFYVDEENRINGGIEYQIVHEIINHWRHDYQIVNSTANYLKWGAAIKSVLNKTADIATCSQWHAKLNFSEIDSTYPLRQICVTFLVPKARLLPHFTFIFQPFTTTLWISIVIVYIFVTISIKEITQIISRLLGEDYFGNILKADKTVIFFYLFRLWTLGSLKSMPRPAHFTLVLIFGFWLFVCLIYSTYYAAGITSSLTNPRFSGAVKTLQDMADYKIKWLEDVYLKKMFESSHIERFRQLADLTAPVKRRDVAVITKKLSNLYLTDTEYLDEYDLKHLTVLKECFAQFYVVFPIRRRSPYKKIIDKYYARFQEQGLVQFWLTNITYFDHSQKFFESLYSLYFIESDQYCIDLERLMGAFYLLLCGHISAFLIFLCEYFKLHIVIQ